MDLKVCQALGVYGVSVATALTAQNTGGVRRLHRIPPRFVADQIDVLAADLAIAAAKTGMLDRAQIVEVVAERVRRRSLRNLVVDPVILAKDGTPLLNGRSLELLRKRLLPLALAVTPNVPEAEALSGVEIRDDADLEEAARRIRNLGVAAVVIKGGHLPGEPVDTLYWEEQFFRFPGERAEGTPVHGTGCMFSTALAASVALGESLPEACRRAKALVRAAIQSAHALGHGSRLAVPAVQEERTER